MHTIRVPEEEKRKGYEESLTRLELNFPNKEKETVNQVQQVQRVPQMINPRRKTTRHTTIKLTKTKHKERILKAAREKPRNVQGKPHTLNS